MPMKRMQDLLHKDIQPIHIQGRSSIAVPSHNRTVHTPPPHLANGIGVADVGQELVAHALSLAGALHEASNVDKLHGGGNLRQESVDRCEGAGPRNAADDNLLPTSSVTQCCPHATMPTFTGRKRKEETEREEGRKKERTEERKEIRRQELIKRTPLHCLYPWANGYRQSKGGVHAHNV